MVQSVPEEDFRPTDRICVTIMNGKTDLLRLNQKYSDGRFADLTIFLNNDYRLAVQGAKNLGATILKHFENLDFDGFHNLIKELNKILRDNAAAGKKTFIYF